MTKIEIISKALQYLALTLICVLSFSLRLFSVVKYESVIHEFDPYFNYRVTKFLSQNGFYSLWNWFDDQTWYPLGRVIGGTVYPGLIFTAGIMYKILHFFNIPIHVQEVCVFTAPVFSALCALACYGLVRQARGPGAALLAALFMGTVPTYMSRSVGGSYDNEGVAIFALVNCFYCFLKTVNSGSLRDAVLLCLAYLYMVMSWGGYSFVINLLPLYCLVCMAFGRMSGKLYVAFAPLVAIGTLCSCSIPVVGFNAVLMSEHFGAFLAFAAMHAYLFVGFVRRRLDQRRFRLLAAGLLLLVGAAVALVASVVVAYVLKSPTLGWTGRSMTLLDPTYASRFVPIIASVSEHQPTQWSSYLTDLHVLVAFAPLGLVACIRSRSDAAIFFVLYGLTAAYFSGVMIRLMLVLGPAVCCLAAVGISDLLDIAFASIKKAKGEKKTRTPSPSGDAIVSGPVVPSSETSAEPAAPTPSKKKSASSSASGVVAVSEPAQSDKPKKASSPRSKRESNAKSVVAGLPRVVVAALVALVIGLLSLYLLHCVHASADLYSSPSIVLLSHTPSGRYVFDDFREAYAWLRHNTAPDAKVASWWDYGYQTTAMAERAVIVDNNTWNTTHIATVGCAMSSPEAKAWAMFKALDVEYVFVVFGGLIGYSGDDINKFLWMVRIGGGVYPEIRERDYLANGQEYRVDSRAPKALLNSLVYRLSYLDYAEASQVWTGQRGFDRVRQTFIGKMDFKLTHFEEAFTSQHWMMRVYRVRDRPVRNLRITGKTKRPASSQG